MVTRVVIKKARLSFPYLFKPKEAKAGQAAKYSTMLMIPKSDKATVKMLRDAEKEAAEAGKSTKFGGKIPSNLSSIIHDGDEEVDDWPEREGMWCLSVSSSEQYRPGIVDKNRQAVLDQSEVYSGVYANVSLTAFAYNVDGNKGVSFGLNNVQILGFGENLAGGMKAEDEFDDEEVEEDLI